MFVYNHEVTPTPCEPGVTRKVLCHSKDLMMCEISFKQGAKGNFHTHPHQQITYVIAGSFAFTIDGETRVVKAGDSVYMPSGSLHGCECLEEGKLCDVFTPEREEFL